MGPEGVAPLIWGRIAQPARRKMMPECWKGSRQLSFYLFVDNILSASRGCNLPRVKYSPGGKVNRCTGAESAVPQELHWNVVMTKELSRNTKLSMKRSIYIPTLIYGHKL